MTKDTPGSRNTTSSAAWAIVRQFVRSRNWKALACSSLRLNSCSATDKCSGVISLTCRARNPDARGCLAITPILACCASSKKDGTPSNCRRLIVIWTEEIPEYFEQSTASSIVRQDTPYHRILPCDLADSRVSMNSPDVMTSDGGLCT